jgi:hypothetical protein
VKVFIGGELRGIYPIELATHKISAGNSGYIIEARREMIAEGYTDDQLRFATYAVE